MSPDDASAIVELLGLEPHPEGGYFRETYRSRERAGGLDARYAGDRAVATAIYYLLTPSTFSEMHRLASDEVFHHYRGDAVEQLQLSPEGGGRVVVLGPDLAAGERPQVVVPRGVWQGARLVPGGGHGYALLGTTVAPGFDFADYESGDREQLVAAYPAHVDRILALTHRHPSGRPVPPAPPPQ